MSIVHDATLLHLIAGTPHAATPVDDAVARRFRVIRSRLTPRGAGHCYDGRRTRPESLGWRFAQYYGTPPDGDVLAGAYDAAIEATWHDAADAEHYYRHDKDWGSFG
jgi:hypothetical protein